MKKKTVFSIPILIIGLILLFANSCEKDEPKSAPLINTTAVTEITKTSAISGGNVTNDGGTGVTSRGICWSKNKMPTINDSKTTNGTGTGSFSGNITGLTSNTTYYVRAFATNSVGTSYGNEVTFKTLEDTKAPTITTAKATDITQTTAVSGGDITDDGGAEITARGVCWSKKENPTVSDSKTSDGKGKGSFTSNITKLEANTKYYVRAYATNSVGTSYGENVVFTTEKATPTSEPMVLQFNTNKSPGTTVTLPLYGAVDVTVDWGDSNSNKYTIEGNQSHTYAKEGTYTVEISGSLKQFGQYNYPNADKLIKVISFGNIGLNSLDHAFHKAINLIEVPINLPSTVSNLEAMFREASSFNFDIGGWDVSNVHTMRIIFREASSFNQDISSWDVSNVGDMDYMFDRASAFNQNIGSWDVSKAWSMFSMFNGASSFNQDISSWNVSNVSEMSYMFSYATAFNQNISSWDVSKVYNMRGMFRGAAAFNQNIGNWDLSIAIDLSEMFSNATAFDQDIGSWNISNVTKLSEMFKDVTLSTANYDKLLIGWAGRTVKKEVVFDGGNSKYSAGAAADARAKLIGTYEWTITDGGEE